VGAECSPYRPLRDLGATYERRVTRFLAGALLRR
jgi:hypothetical protein